MIIKTYTFLENDEVFKIEKECFSNVSSDFIIYGVAGSAAETYAKENNITFKDISGAPAINVPSDLPAKVPSATKAPATVAPTPTAEVKETPAPSTGSAVTTEPTATAGVTTPTPVVTETSVPATSTPVPATTAPVNTEAPTATPTPIKVKKASISSVKRKSSKKAVVKWKKISGVIGYQIVYSTKKSFSKKTMVSVSSKKTSYTISKLKKGTKYYVKVRAYKKDSNGKKVYGTYSNVKTIAKK